MQKIIKKFISLIFSVKNEHIYKVVTIFGIKLKFKNRRLEFENKYQEEISLLKEEIKTISENSNDYNKLFNNHNELSRKVDHLRRYVVTPPSKELLENTKDNVAIKVFIPTNFNKIGRNTYAQSDLWVQNPLQTNIGSFCSIGREVVIGHGEHPTMFLSSSPFFYLDVLGYKNSDANSHNEYYTQNLKGVEIGNDVWIGNGAFIKNGLKIGDGAIIGARSVVTKDVPPYSIVVGTPAKVIKYRFEDRIIKELLELKWWDLDDEIIKKIPYDNIEEAIKFLKTVREDKCIS